MKVLLFDYAAPHRAKVTTDKLAELDHVHMPHPPYLPDISPCDYDHFLCLQEFFTPGLAVNRQNNRIISWNVSAAIREKNWTAGRHILLQVWFGVIHFKGRSPLVFIESGVKSNKNEYQKTILEDVLKPWADAHFENDRWCFEQDSAPAHKARTTQQWYKCELQDFIAHEYWTSNNPWTSQSGQMLYAYDIALLVGVQRQMEKAVQLWQGVLADKDLWLNVKKTKLVGIGAVLCPLLAITSTYGIICLVGSRVNSMLFVMPFLVMGVGVDASFLMVYSWQRQIRYDYEVSQRMGVVYEECIPSISITSLTNVLSFAIGALTPTPEVRIFCLGTALAMGLTFIFQLILFGPLLAIATAGEKPHSSDDDFNSGWRAKLVSVLIFGLVAIYWYFAISGLITMKSRLDAKKILPSDSQLHYANSLQENYVWNEMFMPRFFVNTRFDLNNTTLTNQFWFMLQELESLPRCKGPDSSYVWFRGYVQSYNKTKEKYPIDAIYDPNRIDHFLRTDYYNFKAVIKFGNDSTCTNTCVTEESNHKPPVPPRHSSAFCATTAQPAAQFSGYFNWPLGDSSTQCAAKG
ncbi:unnamed protein product [Heligmosomoides polygyrus]|uniref:SSD domain-containing protein n=1 Tax=Heligmosomoides polygyrus TaxID=6339 RepID=A0A3P7YUL3_HELPZ|nr:unnamed protein product [Heligmosomoides polygyrus]